MRTFTRVLGGVIALLAMSTISQAQTMSVIPRAQFGNYPTTFFEACNNMSAWPTVRARTSQLGSFQGDLASADDATLQQCISNLISAGMQLTIEAAPLQPPGIPGGGCGLASDCYPGLYSVVSRLQALGLSPSSMRIRLQEPLTDAHQARWGNDDDVVNQVVIFMSYLQSDFPGIRVTSVEAYPYNSVSNLQWWIPALKAACNAAAVSPPDSFELDHDANAPGWSWDDVRSLMNTSRANGWTFGYIYGSPALPGWTWQHTASAQGYALYTTGITPDIYVFESWETTAGPAYTVPESSPDINSVMTAAIRYNFLTGPPFWFPW